MKRAFVMRGLNDTINLISLLLVVVDFTFELLEETKSYIS